MSSARCPRATWQCSRWIGASGLATVPLGNSDDVTVGQSMVAIGNAGGTGTLSVVTGTVTSTNRTITASDASGAKF